jgi:hypothetical protein
MQLSLDFQLEQIDTESNNEIYHYLQEYKKWNFSNLLLEKKISTENLIGILLSSTDTQKKVKLDILKYLISKIDNLSSQMDEEYKNTIRQHNDELRKKLKDFYKKANPQKLEDMKINKEWKYNNKYWDMYWGKQINNIISVTHKDHEWHNKYLDQLNILKRDLIDKIFLANMDDLKDELMETYYLFVKKILNQDNI